VSLWKLDYTPGAERSIRKLPKGAQAAILDALDRLVFEHSNPREPKVSNLKKLGGRGEAWRLRVGDYRVIFERQGDCLVILVLHVGNRRDVYKG
jgi:mRNA interferase RelE/StbE